MVKYSVTEDAEEITVSGSHYDAGDSPASFPFTRTHALGTSRAVIKADVVVHLRANDRAGYSLADYKTAKMILCDEECRRRIAVGVEYPAASGKFFSFSVVAQINLNALKHGRAGLTFPYRISTLDNQGSHELADVADCDAFYDAAFDQKGDTLEDVNTVKQNIRVAVDFAAVDTTSASYLGGGAP